MIDPVIPDPAPAAPPAPAAVTARRPRLRPPSLVATLLAGLRLLLMLSPDRSLRLRPAGQFWVIALLSIATTIGWQFLETQSPRLFNAGAVKSDALICMLLLGMSHGLCALCGLTLRSWTLAVTLLAALFWLGLFAPILQLWAPASVQWQSWVLYGLLLWWLLIVLRGCAHVLREWSWPYRSGAALLLVGAMSANWLLLNQERYVYAADEFEDMGDTFLQEPEPAITGSAEQVMYAQPQLLEAALSQIRPGVPGTPELFALAFGGDGAESVFRNEVEFIEPLLSQRFGAAQRVLKLVNSPDTVDDVPLATLSNLRLALRGLHERMDEEDLLLLFLTSHGSEDHTFYVNLSPLALDQITPDDLASALREAEIGVRVVLISACYSGGFLTALDDPRALVITAARADRPSFGCGAESDITYFGRALLVEALNQTQDFESAFKLARSTVTRREKAERQRPSYPQIRVGALAAAAVERWQATLPADPPAVEFAPDQQPQ